MHTSASRVPGRGEESVPNYYPDEQRRATARQDIAAYSAWQQLTADARCLIQTEEAAPEIQEALVPFTSQPITARTAPAILTALSNVRPLGRSVCPTLRATVEQDAESDRSFPGALAAPGLTYEERERWGRPYRIGRETMLLALQAELTATAPDTASNPGGTTTYRLPSGVEVTLRDEAVQDTPGLLQPQEWGRYRQLHDRVYRLKVGPESFILKERKTAQHISVVEEGHVDGLTSRQEFFTAHHFASLPPVKEDGITLTFEQPVGFADFPNDHQFCLFEQADFDADGSNTLRRSIERAQNSYGDEYKNVRHRLASEQDDPLSYPDYAHAKALVRVLEAQMVLGRVILEEGYVNADSNDYGLCVQGGSLDIIGIDFEYFCHAPPEASIKLAAKEHMYDDNLAQHIAYTLGSAPRNVRAAAYCLLDDLGW